MWLEVKENRLSWIVHRSEVNTTENLITVSLRSIWALKMYNRFRRAVAALTYTGSFKSIVPLIICTFNSGCARGCGPLMGVLETPPALFLKWVDTFSILFLIWFLYWLEFFGSVQQDNVSQTCSLTYCRLFILAPFAVRLNVSHQQLMTTNRYPTAPRGRSSGSACFN